MGLGSSSGQQLLDGPREIILDPEVSSDMIVSLEGICGKTTASNSHRVSVMNRFLVVMCCFHIVKVCVCVCVFCSFCVW